MTNSAARDGFIALLATATPSTRRLLWRLRRDLSWHVIVETMVLEDLGDGRTRLVNTSLFHTTDERDGMLQSGMEEGLNQSYAALDRVLASMKQAGASVDDGGLPPFPTRLGRRPAVRAGVTAGHFGGTSAIT
ncbi:MAG TPA: hypothetical protein VF981_17335 [Gemmatimonadaceae bacterium]